MAEERRAKSYEAVPSFKRNALKRILRSDVKMGVVEIDSPGAQSVGRVYDCYLRAG